MQRRTVIITCLFIIGCDAEAVDVDEFVPEFRVEPSLGCDGTPNTASGTFMVNVGGVNRNYRIDAPANWNGLTPIPVLYTFHACGSSEQNTAWNSLWARTTNASWLANDVDPYPVLVVSADAAGACWNIAPSGPDLPYYDAMRAAVEGSYCIDGERRYHAGVSSGGFAAQGFACRRDGVAAVWAALSGMNHVSNPYGLTVHPLPEPEDCNGPVPIMAMASATDTLVPATTYTRPARDTWLEINGCNPSSGTPYQHRVPAANGAAGGPGLGTACTGQNNCSCLEYSCTGERTVWCEFNGTGTNGHSWPIYYRDATANWLGRFVNESGSGGGSSDEGDSSCELICPCDMVCM